MKKVIDFICMAVKRAREENLFIFVENNGEVIEIFFDKPGVYGISSNLITTHYFIEEMDSPESFIEEKIDQLKEKLENSRLTAT